VLERWLPWYRPLFGWFGAIVWCAVVGFALFNMAAHWPELTEDISDRVLAPQNLFLMWLTFPLLKLAHEFGHACATKVWGGEVHEMGVMLLVLMPIPYVDASASSAFREARRRAIVGAAGMLVEVFIAAIALFVWLQIEPGIVRAVLYNIMLIAGISTVVFNANPLLRYDGYYILSDLIQIPNLRVRANQYLGWLMETRLFGVRQPEIEATRSERRWFAFFAVASFLYRNFVMLAIAIFIAGQYMIVGVILALWVLITAIFLPLLKGAAYVVSHPRLRRRRVRAVSMTVVFLAGLYALLMLVPVPLWTRAEGVIWVPEDAQVRAASDGFVKQVAAVPGSIVTRGHPLLVAENPALDPKIRVLEAQLRLLQRRAQAEELVNLVRREITREEIRAAEAELAHMRRLKDELVITSPTSGRFVLAVPPGDLPDRYLRKGQQVGYVVPDAGVTARVMVPQDDVDMVRERTERIEVKLAGRIYNTYPATMRREVPAASNRIANPALSTIGGGRVAVDPRATQEPTSLDTWFDFELELPAVHTIALGEHVYVRFEHGSEPVGWRIYRTVRQLFMRQFTV
jgi:putative peptide zinc metalloprotease protein